MICRDGGVGCRVGWHWGEVYNWYMGTAVKDEGAAVKAEKAMDVGCV